SLERAMISVLRSGAWNFRMSLPVVTSQSRAVLSQPPDSNLLPSGKNAREVTDQAWRSRVLPRRMIAPGGSGSPYWSSRTFFGDLGAGFGSDFGSPPNPGHAARITTLARTKPPRREDMAFLLAVQFAK